MTSFSNRIASQFNYLGRFFVGEIYAERIFVAAAATAVSLSSVARDSPGVTNYPTASDSCLRVECARLPFGFVWGRSNRRHRHRKREEKKKNR